MRGLSTIILGYDFSDGAKHAARAALDLARGSGEVRMAVVTALPAGVDREALAALRRDGHTAPGEAEALALESYTQMAQSDFETLDTSGVTVTFDAAEGAPVKVLLDAARDYDAELLVVGAVGKNAASGAQPVGTDTFRLVRHAPVPVLVVRRDSTWPPANVLVGTDLSAAATCALESAIDLADTVSAAVHVLHIDDDKTGEADFQRAVEAADIDSVAVTRQTVSGTPWEVLTKRGREYDLLALGSVGRSAIMEFLLGGTAERVLRQMPASMLFVKADEAAIKR